MLPYSVICFFAEPYCTNLYESKEVLGFGLFKLMKYGPYGFVWFLKEPEGNDDP